MATSKNDPRRLLGLRVKELRALGQITQEELAERCGFFRTYLSRIESGLANPTLTALHALARGLGVELHTLLDPPTVVQVPRVRSSQPVSRGRVAR